MSNRGKMVEFDAKWAYWINPKTLRFSRVKKQVQVDSIVLTKNQETTDDGRVFVVTTFGITKNEGVIRINKDKASIILTQQVIDYMKQRSEWPPFTTIKEVYKNGNVDLSYTPSEFDKFILKVTEQLIGTNVQGFLSSLKEVVDPDSSWIVELARSDRAICRTCNNKIGGGQLRFGEPYLYENKLSYKWHHPDCVSKRIITLLLSKIEGYEDLSKEQKDALLNLILHPKK
jgi:hypothetical protein